jgi:hypothetical protein
MNTAIMHLSLGSYTTTFPRVSTCFLVNPQLLTRD